MKHHIKQEHIKRTLPTQFLSLEEETQKDSSLTYFYYDTFAFRDRLTNKYFQYRQARKKKQNINLQDWTKNETNINNELKASLKVYQYTKKFEINCMRSKYLRQTYNQRLERQRQDRSKYKQQIQKGQRELSRDQLYQINKGQMKRMLQTNEHISPDILQLNRSTRYQYSMSKNKNKLNKLKFINNPAKENDFSGLDQIQKRQTQKIMNHMQNQIKSNCQYLLNIPIEKKKNNLFKKQLRNYRNQESILSKLSNSQISSQKFSSQDLSISINALQIKNMQSIQQKESNNQLLFLVKKGYMNQVGLQIKNNQASALIKDQTGNNVFHIAAKQGNLGMARYLLKIIPNKTCLLLLSDRNRLKRTPKDKAKMLGCTDMVNLFQQYLHENRHIII